MKEKREAIAWFEKTKKAQRALLKKSITKQRGYVTTNYTLAKGTQGKKRKYITRKEYEEQQKVLRALEKTSALLTVETDVTTILEKIARTVATALGAKQASFFDFTPDRKGAFIRAAYGIQNQYIEHSRVDPLPIGGAWLGRAMSTGQAWATSDVQKDPVLPASWLPAVKKQNYHGLLCLPLMRGNTIIGGICIYYKDRHKSQFFEIDVMTIVANQAATAIENARIFGDLEAEREKTLAIVYSLSDGLVLYDLENRITLVNPRAQELLLLNINDVLNKKLDGSFASKNIYLQNLFRIRQMMQKDYETREFTTEGPQKVVLQVTQVPVRGSEKRKIGTVLILHDITREKEIEQLKANFVTVASHQLRTPISGIKWSLDMLRKGEKGALNSEQKDLTEKSFQATEHMANLVNDLLDASRIEEGRFGYAFTTGDLLPLVEKVISDLKPNAESRTLDFAFEKPTAPLPAASFDASKLVLAIQNVIDNAIKYTELRGTVRIKIRPERSSLFIIVEDTGIGIPEKSKKFIFNKFFRGENAIRYQTEGSGLGLYIAKSIVEKHNGTITFESTEGTGSTFMIQLPTDPAHMPKGALET
ncbi:MAG: GAF domain-containing sensor histidine kinase [Candidatus Niyogibacteria bacterium]|nr:GAF domain-containing sensor histidine kinase [Candidatus Niyogibacteria bacterium]